MPAATPQDPARRARISAELQRDRDLRQQGYRDRALKLFSHVCGRCGRAFSGKRLRELTVHHRDHDHTNNPLDGSNWELLCLYCHDHEHEKFRMKGFAGAAPDSEPSGPPLANPFANLDALLKPASGSPPTQEQGN